MRKTRQGLAWFLMLAAIVMVLSVIIYVFLDSSMMYLLDLAEWSAGDSPRTTETVGYIESAWNLWPLFGIGLPLVLFLYRRAGTESSPR